MTTETNAERLERVKAIHDRIEVAYEDGDPRMELHDLLGELFFSNHTDWLIQQAEKLQALEESLEEELGGR